MMLSIIISAENASARFGGEAFLPLNYFRLLRARGIDVVLVVHERNRSELTQTFPQDIDRLYFVEDTAFHKFLFKIGSLLPRRVAGFTTGLLMQLTTQRSQQKLIKGLQSVRRYDVVHVPNPVSPKAPLAFNFGGQPALVVGPMNGGMEYPEAFRKAESWFTRRSVSIARALSNIFNRVWVGKLQAEVLVVANQRTREALPSGTTGQIFELVENGVDFAIWHREPKVVSNAAPGGPRFAFVGRLVDWKALDIVLDALCQLDDLQDLHLDVIGDGPMLSHWKEYAANRGLASKVSFWGWMDQKACAQKIKLACALVLPSVYECGGAVVLEAMAMSVPVVATAWGGPLDYLDESCGILIPPKSRSSMVSDFANALRRMSTNEQFRYELGKSGFERAKKFDWERKIDKIIEIYKLAKDARIGQS